MTPDRNTEMPRTALPRDAGRSEAVVWAMAAAFSAVFAVGQIVTVLAVAPAAVSYHQANAPMPALVAMAAGMGPVLIAVALAALDALLFGAFVLMARRYWIGFAYLPPMVYLGLGSVIIWLLAAGFLAELAAKG